MIVFSRLLNSVITWDTNIKEASKSGGFRWDSYCGHAYDLLWRTLVRNDRVKDLYAVVCGIEHKEVYFWRGMNNDKFI
jgi:hypothetical protein